MRESLAALDALHGGEPHFCHAEPLQPRESVQSDRPRNVLHVQCQLAQVGEVSQAVRVRQRVHEHLKRRDAAAAPSELVLAETVLMLAAG